MIYDLRKNTGGGGITSIVEDLTPELGGHLDVKGKTIFNSNASGGVIIWDRTKLGVDAPAVRMKKFTGVTHSSIGASTAIAHGVISSKILAVDCLIEYTPGFYMKTESSISIGRKTHITIDADNILIHNNSTDSAFILNKPFKVIITYEG